MYMRSFKTGDMQRQTKQILDAAKREGQVEIVRGKERFLVTFIPEGDGEDSAPGIAGVSGNVPEVNTNDSVNPGVLEQMLAVQQEILAHLKGRQVHEDAPVPEKGTGAVMPMEQLLEHGFAPAHAPDPTRRSVPALEPLDHVTPEEVEAAFGNAPEPEEALEYPAPVTETPAALEARRMTETGVRWDSGRWVLTVAATEAPEPYFKALLTECRDEEEIRVLKTLGARSPEVLEMIRLRGSILRKDNRDV